MVTNVNKPEETEKSKQAPQHVSANTEAEAKEKTDPVKGEKANPQDRDEGDMNNGELGGGMRE